MKLFGADIILADYWALGLNTYMYQETISPTPIMRILLSVKLDDWCTEARISLTVHL